MSFIKVLIILSKGKTYNGSFPKAKYFQYGAKHDILTTKYSENDDHLIKCY